MYKIIIVDDELEVREGIKETIDWKHHGFELIGDFKDGREAIAAMEHLKPDLVLSDICMPFMDGLELTREIKERFTNVKVMIITGYDEFEYARAALRLNADDFILKPITALELGHLLDKVRLTLDEERKKIAALQQVQIQLNQSLPLLRENMLSRMLEFPIPETKADEQLRNLGLPQIQADFIVLIIDIDNFGDRALKQLTELDKDLLRFAVFNITEELLVSENSIVLRTREQRIVAVLHNRLGEFLVQHAFECAERLRETVYSCLNFTVSVGIGHVVCCVEQLPESYNSAANALQYRMLLGINRVFSIHEMEKDMSKLQVLRAAEYIESHYADENISLQQVCRYVHMSLSHFSLLFKQQLGMTFVEYLTQIRIEKSKQLLCHTHLKTYEIAGAVGIRDPHYFSILFKKHTGLTPREYRKLREKEQPNADVSSV